MPDHGLPSSTPETQARLTRYWRRNVRLVSVLMALGFVMTFGVIWFARELSAIHFFGWPLSFYMAAQGSILVYVAIVWFYAWRMDVADRRERADDGS